MTIIERASSGDFEHICALDETVHQGAPRRRFIGEACARGHVAVARVDDAIRGFVIFDESFFDQFFVRLLLVHPDFRRHGLATALMRAAELECQAPRCSPRPTSRTSRCSSCASRLGYVKSGYVENFDEGDPELIYVKLLAPR